MNVNSAVAAQFIAAQTVSVGQKRKTAIATGMDLFRIGTRTSMIPFPLTTTLAQFTCASLICRRGLCAFGYNNINSDLVLAMIKNHWDGTWATILGQFTVGAACCAIAFPPSIVPSIAIGLASGTIFSAASVPRPARIIVLCIADVVLILDKAFWVRRGLEDAKGVITDEDIRSASTWYQRIIQSVHRDIEACLSILSVFENTVIKSLFKPDLVEERLKEIIDKYRWRPKKESDDIKNCSRSSHCSISSVGNKILANSITISSSKSARISSPKPSSPSLQEFFISMDVAPRLPSLLIRGRSDALRSQPCGETKNQ